MLRGAHDSQAIASHTTQSLAEDEGVELLKQLERPGTIGMFSTERSDKSHIDSHTRIA
jgi:hypothetical protein